MTDFDIYQKFKHLIPIKDNDGGDFPQMFMSN